MGMQKLAKQGYEEKVPDEHRMRITLSCERTGTLKVKGLVRIPTKVAKIVVEYGIQNTNNKIMVEELKYIVPLICSKEFHADDVYEGGGGEWRNSYTWGGDMHQEKRTGREPFGKVTSVKTIDAINMVILSMDYKKCQADIKTIDAQDSYKGGVVVQVTGCLIVKDNMKRKFTQSFCLTPQDRGYFVLNDIFRYVIEYEMVESDTVAIAVNGVIENATSTPVTPDPEVEVSYGNGEVVHEPSYNGELSTVEVEVVEAPVHSGQDEVLPVTEPASTVSKDLASTFRKILQRIKLYESRLVVGTLLGFKQFRDLVLENTLEMNGNNKNYIGMVKNKAVNFTNASEKNPINKSFKAAENGYDPFSLLPVNSLRFVVWNDRTDFSEESGDLPKAKSWVLYRTKQAVIGLSLSPEPLGKLPRASFPARVTSVFMFTSLSDSFFHCAFHLARSQMVHCPILETIISATGFESPESHHSSTVLNPIYVPFQGIFKVGDHSFRQFFACAFARLDRSCFLLSFYRTSLSPLPALFAKVCAVAIEDRVRAMFFLA
ncbi:hypothetical protein IFM89_032060 [Coptis chinensis]|uniref:NTF2 domain-containing protein n=1 Tax=Coptis chinensis TaxID=261450 RepID=A0A835I639_9MAGN|nr:hypothetical protein IFM89_032060 [Coptis chinensis]